MKNINKNILFLALGIISPLSAMNPNNKKITDLPTEVLWTLADCDNPAKSLEWMNNLAQTNKELHDKISTEILTYLCKKESGKSDNHSTMQSASKHGMLKVIDHVKKQTPSHIDHLHEKHYINPLFAKSPFKDVLVLMHHLRSTSKDMKNRYDKTLEHLVRSFPNRSKFFTVHAIEDGSPRLLELVLKFSNIDINCVSFDNPSYFYFPLSRAVELRRSETLKLLLKQTNIDVNKPDSQGITPLAHAINNHNLHALRLLLKNDKINVNKKSKHGESPLIDAISLGSVEAVRILLNHPNIDVNDVSLEYGLSPLWLTLNNSMFLSSRSEHKKFFEILRLLLKHKKMNVNKRNPEGTTALLSSIINENKIITQLLLQDSRTDVNLARLDGLTPLMAAILYNNIPALNMLLKHPNIRPNVPKLFLLANDNDEICEILKAWTKRKK